MRLPLLISCVALLFFSACSGVQQTEGQPRSEQQPAEERSEETNRLSAFETFDPAMYTVAPKQREVTIQHVVPARLMQGEASRGIRRTVEGFRIQIFSSQQKTVAERRLTEARDWWAQQRQQEDVPDDLFAEVLGAVIEYRQPYYRVRIGSFAERDRAEEALTVVKRQYPDSFIARSTVTITR